MERAKEHQLTRLHVEVDLRVEGAHRIHRAGEQAIDKLMVQQSTYGIFPQRRYSCTSERIDDYGHSSLDSVVAID